MLISVEKLLFTNCANDFNNWPPTTDCFATFAQLMRAGWQPCRNLGLGKSQFYDKEDKEPGNTLLPDPEEDICPSLQIKNAEPKTKIRNIYWFFPLVGDN